LFHSGNITSPFPAIFEAVTADLIVSISAKTFEFLVLSFLLAAILAHTIASKATIEITMIISTREKAFDLFKKFFVFIFFI
jgi:hypothetical protein